MMSLTGFTLIELLIVVSIVLILTGIALPNYYKAKERALGKEAIANIKLIQAAEKIYKMENNKYYPESGIVTSIADINSNLKLLIPTSAARNWDYEIRVPYGSGDYGIFAYRSGSGGYLDCVYYIEAPAEEPGAYPSCP